jgi:ribonuclease Z
MGNGALAIGPKLPRPSSTLPTRKWPFWLNSRNSFTFTCSQRREVGSLRHIANAPNIPSHYSLIGPTGAKALMSNLERAYAADIKIRIADEKLPAEGARLEVEEFAADGIVFDQRGVTVTAFEVDHGDLIKPAYGYRIDYGGRTIVLSSDTRYNENVVKYGTGADLLIHEVAIARPELMVEARYQRVMARHTTAREAGLVFARTRPKLAAYTHLVFLTSERVAPASMADLLAGTRQSYDGPLEIGEDLMSFQIGENVVVKRYSAAAAARC